MSASTFVRQSSLERLYPGAGQETKLDVKVFKQHLDAAKNSLDHQVKKANFEAAFKLISPHLPDANKALYKLFHEYGSQICYNQTIEGDTSRGFLQSAVLMQLSAMMQLQDKGLVEIDFDPKKFGSLAEIVEQLERTPVRFLIEDDGSDLIISKEVALEHFVDEDERQLFADTLIRINFSHQNHPPHREKPYIFHQKSNELTEALIGSTTEAQLRKLADFQYNRCRFIAMSKDPTDTASHVRSYDEVLTLLQKCYEEKHPVLLGKISQIKNMQGLHFLNQQQYDISEDLHREAFMVREQLLSMPEEAGNKNDHLYFLSNIRTSLIHELLKHNPTPDRIQEAVQHSQALLNVCLEYANNHDANTYRANWMNAIRFVSQTAPSLLESLKNAIVENRE